MIWLTFVRGPRLLVLNCCLVLTGYFFQYSLILPLDFSFLYSDGHQSVGSCGPDNWCRSTVHYHGENGISEHNVDVLRIEYCVLW